MGAPWPVRVPSRAAHHGGAGPPALSSIRTAGGSARGRGVGREQVVRPGAHGCGEADEDEGEHGDGEADGGEHGAHDEEGGHDAAVAGGTGRQSG